MRQLFTAREHLAAGGTSSELEWGVRTGRWIQPGHGVYAPGPEPPTRLEIAAARVYGTDRVGDGLTAAVLLGLDGLQLELPSAKRLRRPLVAGDPIVVHGVRCTNGLQTVIDIAPMLNDSTWEMASESGLHKALFTVPDLEAMLPLLSARRVSGTRRIRRVLAVRPPGAPPTESALETLMVQLIRTMPEISEPTRQYALYDEYGVFVARIDLCWPELGVFIELDGQGHAGQPVYDASRESAIVAETGWLRGRFTWTEVHRHPQHTARRLARIIDQARRRPLDAHFPALKST